MPITGELSQQNIKDRYYGVNDPVALKLLGKAGEMSSLSPPDDESIKTLYVGGLDSRITEQDLRDHFYGHGEIESIRLVPQRACAFVCYTAREGAEKAAEELSNKLVIKGLRLKLMWGKPQVQIPEAEAGDDEAARQGLVSHGSLLPRSVISQQQSGQQLPVHYFNIPPPLPSERSFYPSIDPQRMGAMVAPSQEQGEGKGGLERRPRGEEGSSQMYLGPPSPYYPLYAYMAPPPPHHQHQHYNTYLSTDGCGTLASAAIDGDSVASAFSC